jgi:hypothetical protein
MMRGVDVCKCWPPRSDAGIKTGTVTNDVANPSRDEGWQGQFGWIRPPVLLSVGKIRKAALVENANSLMQAGWAKPLRLGNTSVAHDLLTVPRFPHLPS